MTEEQYRKIQKRLNEGGYVSYNQKQANKYQNNGIVKLYHNTTKDEL